MTAERWEYIKRLYSSALEVEPSRRAAFLRHACGTNETLLAELQSLLAEEPRAAGFLETPALDLAAKAMAAKERGADLTGHRLLHYRIAAKIGAGGMGTVYRARDERLQRDVAIKVLAGPELVEGTARDRLLHEARAAAALNHPNICIVHEVGEANGQTFIAMELAEGEPLSARLASVPLAPEQVVQYGLQLADALAHAHVHKIVHRDLKAANILVTQDGRVKVLDFGLAERLTSDEIDAITRSRPATGASHVLTGTLAYMAPEQLCGKPADEHSDIWSLGIVLYEMATGKLPFKGETSYALGSAILHDPPAPFPAQVPTGLRAVISRCLEKEPERRYLRAVDVRSALTAVAMGPAITRSSFRLLAWLAAAAFLVVLAVLAGLRPDWRRTHIDNAPPRIKKIAVLPLEDLSPNRNQAYLVDGIHERLTTDLYRFGGLRVIASRSVMAYKGSRKPVSQIASELHGLDALIVGTVSAEGDQIRLTLQLIDTGSGEILWADRYLRPLRDIARLQDEMIARIAERIRVQASPQERARPARRAGRPETLVLYEKGRFFLNKLTLDGFQKGLAYLKQAVEEDPQEPLAWAGVALGYVLIAHQASIPGVADPFQMAKPYAMKAMELDPMLAEAHQAVAEIKLYRDWEFAGAEREFRRALELSNGNIAEAHAHYSWYLMIGGRTGEQVTEMKRAQELDPLNPVYHVWLGQQYAVSGNWDGMMVEARKALELNPEIPDGLTLLGAGYVQKGQLHEGIAYQERAAKIDPALCRYALACTYALTGQAERARRIAVDLRKHPGHWDNYGLALIYTALGEKDEAFKWLEAMYRSRHMYTPWIKVLPELSSLRNDPRFHDFIGRLRLPN